MTPVGVVVIGRNEGIRLQRCLASLPTGSRVVYVDSGSTDGSVDHARKAGCAVVELNMRLPFTAARGRNAGIAYLNSQGTPPLYVQTIDGDCTLNAGWIAKGIAALQSNTELACVFGRRRESDVAASIYNRLCDAEWDVPVGPIESCGGDALFRVTALQEVNGYRDSLIAGEEPDLCLRMRQNGWLIERIADEMTEHDAAITKVSQWWLRAVRAGHAYAEHIWIHKGEAFRSWKVQLMRILFWGMALPVAAVATIVGTIMNSVVAILLVFVLALYIFQFSRLLLRNRNDGYSWQDASKVSGLTLLGKLAEARGVLKFIAGKIFGNAPRIIEYKSPTALR